MTIFSKKANNKSKQAANALEILNSTSPCVMDYSQRVEMTKSCRDTDYIPKVHNAGAVVMYSGREVQIMHNGVMVENGGYFGEWMSEVIAGLKGHHEPQEEKIFFEVLRRLKKPSAMIELGAFWSYYSLWFKNNFPKALSIACEPDPINIEVGRRNAKLNGFDVEFIQSAAGSCDHQEISFKPDSSEYKELVDTEIRTVDGIVDEYNIKNLDMLHIDVQGFEIDALNGAEETVRSGKLRFLFVSTHHYSISGDPATHLRCLEWIKERSGHIVSEHNVIESYSGDGLIVASFNVLDKDFHVETSINSSNNSLFRSYEKDLVQMINEYNSLRSKF